MQIKLQTINLEVADPSVSKRFYLGALGMRENAERSHAPDFFYLESDGCHLTLARRPSEKSPGTSSTAELGFQVDDLEALKEHLNKEKVSGFTSQTMGWGEVIEGLDPDGFRVIVYRLGQR